VARRFDDRPMWTKRGTLPGMSGQREKVVTFEVSIEIDDELALRDAGFVAVRQAGGSLTQADEVTQAAVNTALLQLLRVEPQQLPGARIVQVSAQVRDDNRRERFGLPPLD